MSKELWQNIVSQIKKKREQQGMTMKQLGAKVGAKHSYISRIEAGKTSCSLKKLAEIADALNCELDVVVRGC